MGLPESRTAQVAPPGAADRPPSPDYCNFGIVLRVLLALNAAAVVEVFARAQSFAEAGASIASTAIVLEPAVFITLFVMCALRRRLSSESEAIRIVFAGAIAAASAVGVDQLLLKPLAMIASAQASGSWFGSIATALAACFAGVATAAYLELRARAMSPALSTAKLQALQSRIRPHFFFNSLNAAMSLVRTDPVRAERVLGHLAALFRVLMSDSRRLIPLSDEVALARQYLAIEEVRLGERLHVQWEIHRMPAAHKVPPLLLQPLLENAVRHGIEPSAEPGTIAIRITGVARELIIVIENSYDPGESQPGNGMALANVRDRLMLLYDLEARMRTEGDGKRFRVVLSLPMSLGS